MITGYGLYAVIGMGLLGLMVGSFLNVVVYRLPKMLERQWHADCLHLQGKEASAQERFDLVLPRSTCPHCQHAIRWYENIPVLSYLVLRGRCSACQAPIGLRYPLVELSSALLFAYCGYRFGLGTPALLWAGYCAALLTLTLIDWDTTLLPDDITLPLLWVGLVAAVLHLTPTSVPSAVIGAVAGYLSLWSVYWVFKLVTGKEGMGYGDFKLFAALGAWFGWTALIPMILMASVIGAIVGLGLKLSSGLREGGAMPFGPFLALAGISALVSDPNTWLRAIGLL